MTSSRSSDSRRSPPPRAGGRSEELRSRTLARFERHRAAWQSNRPLRELYGEWYGRVAAELPPRSLGPRIELGSGPGFARQFIPDLILTDVVAAPWHDLEVDGEALPFADASVGALVLFDVLHHVPAPSRFFSEAERVLAVGGRVVMCEPYVGPVSYVVYKLLHEEPVDMRTDPLVLEAGPHRDPFDSNQAIPTSLFDGRRTSAFERRFPSLALRCVRHMAGFSYPASGGFSRRPLLPMPLWLALRHAERCLPEAAFRLIGFRMLVVLERVDNR